MEHVELLEALLIVSADEASIQSLKDNHDLYFDILTGVFVETTKSIAPIKLSSDKIFGLSLKCLINFCADNFLSERLYTISSESRRDQLMGGLVGIIFSDADEEAKYLATSLLLNLTQNNNWADLICGSKHLSVICAKLASKRRPSSAELQLLLNLTTNSKTRNQLCEEMTCLSSLASLLEELTDLEMRTTIVGIIKNCCFEDSFHASLCYEGEHIFIYLLILLCGPEDKVDNEDFEQFPAMIKDFYGKPIVKRETDINLKINVCETLMQLCSTETGRSHLRRMNAYFVLRELHKFEYAHEKDLKNGSKRAHRQLILIIEQVVDQLICEENDRPQGQPSSLRHVPIDEKTEQIMDEANINFLMTD